MVGVAGDGGGDGVGLLIHVHEFPVDLYEPVFK